MEMKRKLRFAVPLAALLLVAACTDGNIAPNPTPDSPTFSATDPNNGGGQCLGDDVLEFGAGFFSGHNGLKNPTDVNCTANDIEIAEATATAVFIGIGEPGADADGFIAINPGDAATCVKGEDVTFKMKLLIQQNSNSVRGDIGLWLATDGKVEGAPTKDNPDGEYGGLTGECNHYNIPTNITIAPPLENADGDQCAGMLGTANATFELDIGTITVPCVPNEDNQLAIAGCSAWNVPGGDFACPSTNTSDGADGFRIGTMPNNSAKCNCDPFVVDINVVEDAELEVTKECVPTGDGGKFDLLIDGSNSFADDVSCGGSTGAQVVGAGTSQDPGAIHTVAELAGTGTSLADYNSTWECTLDGSSTVINQCGTGTDKATYTNACSGSGDGPESILVMPDQDIVCTFENERKAQLRIAKATLPDGDPTDFTFTPTGWNSGSTFTRADNQTAFASGNLNPGPYSVAETVPAGWELTGRACVLTGTATPKTFSTPTATSISVTLSAGEDVTCTFTNTKQAQLRIVKVTLPDGDPTDFTFTPSGWNGGSTFTREDNQAAFASGFLTPGTYSTTETVPSGWDLTDRDCDLTGTATDKAHTNIANGIQVTLGVGEDVTCTFTNTKRATIELEKRESGSTTLTRTWTFELRTGTTTTDAGSLVATASNTPPDGTITFPGTFAPGDYQLCETGMPAGWSNNIPSPPGFTPLGATAEGGDNSTECVNITLSAGQHLTEIIGGLAYIDNTPPPGGDARTIGYWRNHSSCNKNGGKQYDRLVANGDADKTLDFYLPSNPAVFPLGDIAAMTCEQAFNIISKRDFNGTIKANDAAYGLAAQLLAAKLNIASGADASCIGPVIDAAQDLLADGAPDGVNFTGTGSYLGPKSGSPLRAYATALAGLLDDYNNNELVCPVVLPTLP